MIMEDDPYKTLVDRLDVFHKRLSKIDLDQLSDDQVIALAQSQATVIQAQAALWAARDQMRANEFTETVLFERVNYLVWILDCDYRRKYGKFPSDEK